MDEPPATSTPEAHSEGTPANTRRFQGNSWVRLLFVLVVLLAPLGYIISRQAPDLPSRVGNHLFPPALTPTATTPPLLITILRARPLRLPTLPSGSACPVTPAHMINSDTGDAVGEGPVYFYGPQSTIFFRLAQSSSTQRWGAGQLMFLIRPGVEGAVLVRGRQVDGPDEVRFGKRDEPDAELVFRAPAEASPGGISNPWTIAFEIIRLRTAGCYATQVDSETASSVIVFRAEPQRG
jgi:hypothetical protein